jgi:hypothetical protein
LYSLDLLFLRQHYAWCTAGGWRFLIRRLLWLFDDLLSKGSLLPLASALSGSISGREKRGYGANPMTGLLSTSMNLLF